jgi:hypothetical protein
MEQKSNGFVDTFLNKLKEQTFTILILVGIMYYQNKLFSDQMAEYKKLIQEKESLLLKITEDERNRLIERTNYLLQQRDKYVDELINESRN